MSDPQNSVFFYRSQIQDQLYYLREREKEQSTHLTPLKVWFPHVCPPGSSALACTCLYFIDQDFVKVAVRIPQDAHLFEVIEQ